jgi:transcriptional regulator with XRE-family HTH domain
MELYQNIKNRRTELRMSQSELASKVGYKDKGSISRIESGSLDLTQSQIEKFAKALECSPAYLMGWENKISEHTSKREKALKDLYALEELIKQSAMDDYSETEINILNKIKQLDERGKIHVMEVINNELKYLRVKSYGTSIGEYINGKK